MDDILIQGGLYNLNSSESERRQKIEDVLKKTGEPGNKKDEIPNDQMINKFLARNEEEVEYFTKMDEERYLLEAEIYGNKTEFNEIRKNHNLHDIETAFLDCLIHYFNWQSIHKSKLNDAV